MLNTLDITEEKRLYTRIWSQVPLNVIYGDALLARCYTSNLSMGGVLINANIGFTENSLIQIIFDVDKSHCLYEVRIPAIVVRCANNQIAASFENLEKGTEDLINACYTSSYPDYY
jgi:hypothetical protein